MKRMIAALGLLIAMLIASGETAGAQSAGILGGGLGTTALFTYIPMSAGQIPVGQNASQNPLALTLSGDCTMNAAAVVTCTKTNGANFGTAAPANLGTSGSNVPLMSTANTWALAQTYQGHQIAGPTPPVLSACGTSPAILGDDKDGEVTMGTASPTGCVITFAAAYTSKPVCTVSWQATPLVSQSYTVLPASITLVQTATSSNKVNYHCAAQTGG